ncbi:MAG: sugar phosphate isomerase/epimerase family protein [Desulfobacteraceae bacterium]|jgi:sugar phosphate isomerase/epimerase
MPSVPSGVKKIKGQHVKTSIYRFPLAVQMVLPENYRHNQAFVEELKLLQQFGFTGVELNIANVESADMDAIRRFLGQYDLVMTMFASGLTAKTHGLSLSSPDAAIRSRSVEASLRFIDIVHGHDVGLIIGFLKGGPARDADRAGSDFLTSMERIAAYAQMKQVHVLIEATNRYESSVANTVEEAAQLIDLLVNPYLHILPDTFHMNIEEADAHAALLAHQDKFISMHISDNNRYYPGLGAIDFNRVFQTLETIGFSGPVAIEGNLRDSFSADLRDSMAYLTTVLK